MPRYDTTIKGEMDVNEYLAMLSKSTFNKGRVSARHVWINQSAYMRIHDTKQEALDHAVDDKDTLHFASQSEAYRYQQLRLEESEGLIVNLMVQPEFTLISIGDYELKWKADFQYQVVVDNKPSFMMIEDVKSYQEKTGKWFVANGETKLKMQIFNAWMQHHHPKWKFYLVDAHSGMSEEYQIAHFV